MKTITYFLPLLAIPVLMIFMSNKSGSQGGFSSSPGDNGKTCLQCHAGTLNSASGWITSNIPSTGFSPGEVYSITLTATDPNAVRYGFEITAEDALNKKVSGFSLSNVTETKLINSNKSVSHTTAGTDASGNSKSWSFDWTAPAEISGQVTFYASVNAANGNNVTSGDVIYTTSASLSPAVTGIMEIAGSFRFYPNPSKGIVNFESNLPNAESELRIFNSSGQVVEISRIYMGSSQVDLSHLPKGLYYLNLTENGKTVLHKLILQ